MKRENVQNATELNDKVVKLEKTTKEINDALESKDRIGTDVEITFKLRHGYIHYQNVSNETVREMLEKLRNEVEERLRLSIEKFNLL